MLSQMEIYVVVSLKSMLPTTCSSNQRLGIKSAPDRRKLQRMQRVVVHRLVASLTSRPLTSTEDPEDSILTWLNKNQLATVKLTVMLPKEGNLQQLPLKRLQDLTLRSREPPRRFPRVGVQTCLRQCTVPSHLLICLPAIVFLLQLVQFALVGSKNWASRSCTEFIDNYSRRDKRNKTNAQ